MSVRVGIDLGTTRSAIAYLASNGQPEIIPNQANKQMTPSMIYFSKDGPLIGDQAKDRRIEGLEYVAQFFKRCIDDNNFSFSAYDIVYSPIELSTLLLIHLKEQAQNYLGKPVDSAVITVPAYFTDIQRRAVLQAAEAANLQVLTLLSEPTAAALAYNHLYPSSAEQLLLVYDLGGGTFDISLVAISESHVRVLGTDGNHRLGGIDWDGKLLDYVVHQFEHKYQIKLTREERERLFDRVEKAKHALSIRRIASIEVQGGGQEDTYKITRTFFEELTRNLVEETRLLTAKLLDEVNIDWQQVAAILPVGGASRMPMIHATLTQMAGKEPIHVPKPDELVALGAALQTVLQPDPAPHITDVIAHSLGMIVENQDRSRYINHILIPKNSPIPAEKKRTVRVRLSFDRSRTRQEVFLTQGESSDPQHCIYSGCYTFSGFPALTATHALVEISYHYNENGMISISAREQSTQQLLQSTFESKMVQQQERFAGKPTIQYRQEPMTIYLAFDLSGSMIKEPLQQAKQAALSFLDTCNLATTEIGLISFADHAQLNLQATHDKNVISQAIEQLKVSRTVGYGNNADPFELIYTQLSLCWNLRYAVILTDGRWARPELVIQRAHRCHAASIEIFAVGFNTVDKQFLTQIATSASQGILTDMNRLIETFTTIAQDIGEQSEMEVEEE